MNAAIVSRSELVAIAGLVGHVNDQSTLSLTITISDCDGKRIGTIKPDCKGGTYHQFSFPAA